jgi:hypothetical protein
MSPQMDILYMSTLGHVLAIFTRASEPDKIEATPATFVGDGFHLRGIGDPTDSTIDVVVPPSEIALARVPLNPAQLLIPRSLQLPDPKNPALSDLPNTTLPTVALTAGSPPSLTVKAAGAASTLQILALIVAAPAGNPITITGSFPKLTLPSLPAGKYYAVVFVPGYPLNAQSFSI